MQEQYPLLGMAEELLAASADVSDMIHHGGSRKKMAKAEMRQEEISEELLGDIRNFMDDMDDDLIEGLDSDFQTLYIMLSRPTTDNEIKQLASFFGPEFFQKHIKLS